MAEKLPVIQPESLYELHDMLFRKVIAMEAGEVEPDSFVIQLMENGHGDNSKLYG